MRFLIIVTGLCLLLATGWYWHNSHLESSSSLPVGLPVTLTSQPNNRTPVGVATAKRGNIRIFLEELGNVTPRSTVTVHTRVEGQLMRILFKEGQLVKAGDVLAELDASPYQAQLTQAQGQMKKDQALLKEAQVKLDRYKILLAQDTIARQEYDTQESLVHQYEGATELDQGQIESANVQIRYTRIITPITGRIGLRQVDLGNIVHVNDQNGIATIAEMQPISVVFSVPEDNIPAILKHMQKNDRLLTIAYDREEKKLLAAGILAAVDSQVDTTTGTIKCKAEFANKNLALFPNQFVNIRLLLDIKHNVILIPAAALHHGTKGAFVYLVKDDGTVAITPVKEGPAENGNISIESGLEADTVVVVDGADTLRDGSRIAIAHRAPEPAQHIENAPVGKQTEIQPQKTDEEDPDIQHHEP